MIVRMVKLDNHVVGWFVLCAVFQWEGSNDCGKDLLLGFGIERGVRGLGGCYEGDGESF